MENDWPCSLLQSWLRNDVHHLHHLHDSFTHTHIHISRWMNIQSLIETKAQTDVCQDVQIFKWTFADADGYRYKCLLDCFIISTSLCPNERLCKYNDAYRDKDLCYSYINHSKASLKHIQAYRCLKNISYLPELLSLSLLQHTILNDSNFGVSLINEIRQEADMDIDNAFCRCLLTLKRCRLRKRFGITLIDHIQSYLMHIHSYQCFSHNKTP